MSDPLNMQISTDRSSEEDEDPLKAEIREIQTGIQSASYEGWGAIIILRILASINIAFSVIATFAIFGSSGKGNEGPSVGLGIGFLLGSLIFSSILFVLASIAEDLKEIRKSLIK